MGSASPGFKPRHAYEFADGYAHPPRGQIAEAQDATTIAEDNTVQDEPPIRRQHADDDGGSSRGVYPQRLAVQHEALRRQQRLPFLAFRPMSMPKPLSL